MSYLRKPGRPGLYGQRMDWSGYLGQYGFAGATGATGVLQDALTTTWGTNPAEPIANEFAGFVAAGLKGNSIVATCELLRFSVFAEARFIWQAFRNGRPADIFSTPDLDVLETPWEGGTTGDLLARMILDADLAGNAYVVRDPGGGLVRLRPDWCQLILAERQMQISEGVEPATVGYRKMGAAYWQGGKHSGVEPALFLAKQVAHFAPYPDPIANFRGMSWLTPVLREIEIDSQSTRHKGMFFENAATPNLAVSLKVDDPEVFERFVELMERDHAGSSNAYKTLYTGAGADTKVVGTNMQQLDFKALQGAGETRIINAAGLNAVVVSASEGMQGSSLNAGNYGAARRAVADRTFRPLWRNAAGSLQTLVPPPRQGARLWFDDRDIPFLRDDASDVASIQASEAVTIRQLVDAGYTPDSVVAAVNANDWSALQHSGLYSVQLQAPGQNQTTPATA